MLNQSSAGLNPLDVVAPLAVLYGGLPIYAAPGNESNVGGESRYSERGAESFDTMSRHFWYLMSAPDDAVDEDNCVVPGTLETPLQAHLHSMLSALVWAADSQK